MKNDSNITRVKKETLTRCRAENIYNLPFIHNEMNKLKKLEEEYGHYIFLPFNTSQIKIPFDFSQWFFNNEKPVQKQYLKSTNNIPKKSVKNPGLGQIGPGGDVVTWTDVSGSPNPNENKNQRLTKNIIPEFKNLFPEMWQSIVDSLPYSNLEHWRILSSIREVWPHRDRSYFIDLPLEIRIAIIDENPKDTLYVIEDCPGNDLGEKFYLQTKKENYQTWGWNSLRTQHGSDFDNNRKALFIPSIRNPIDWDKFEEILKKSVQEYHALSLISNKTISDFVDEPYMSKERAQQLMP